MNGPRDVKDFYEHFADDVLLEDFRRFNLRHEALRDFCSRFVPRGSRVLEVGCGVGIISRHLLSRGCRVVGVDISENNIRIAQAYAGVFDNAEFKVLDVIEDAEQLATLGVFDVILLPDVIEHIPKQRYPALFGTLERSLSPSGSVLLTFPSPGYQEYLKSNHPEHLQVIDETVVPADILDSTSLELHYYSRCDVWERNQYVQAVLTAGGVFDPTPIEMPFFAKQRYRIMKRLWRFKNRSFLSRLRRTR